MTTPPTRTLTDTTDTAPSMDACAAAWAPFPPFGEYIVGLPACLPASLPACPQPPQPVRLHACCVHVDAWAHAWPASPSQPSTCVWVCPCVPATASTCMAASPVCFLDSWWRRSRPHPRRFPRALLPTLLPCLSRLVGLPVGNRPGRGSSACDQRTSAAPVQGGHGHSARAADRLPRKLGAHVLPPRLLFLSVPCSKGGFQYHLRNPIWARLLLHTSFVFRPLQLWPYPSLAPTTQHSRPAAPTTKTKEKKREKKKPLLQARRQIHAPTRHTGTLPDTDGH